MKRNLPSRLAALLVAMATAPAIPAQTAPTVRAPVAPTQTAPSAGDRDAAVVLSPFEVKETSETGYAVTDSNSALKIAVDTKDLPFTLSIISADLLRDFAALNEIEGLRLNAGVNPVENFITKSQNRPFIRGTSSVRVYADGLFLNSLITPTIAVDRIEVLKGTSGNLFGLGEPGGTLNYVYKPALAAAKGSVTAGVGSWGEKFAQLDLGGPLSSNGKLTSRVGLGYQTGNAYTDYTQFEFREFYGRIRYAFTPDTTLPPRRARAGQQGVSPDFPHRFDDRRGQATEEHLFTGRGLQSDQPDFRLCEPRHHVSAADLRAP
ncbi:MAG: TonB-dependent siderophore receptor [Opitutaceae bacterium]